MTHFSLEELREMRDGITPGSWHVRQQPGFSEKAFGGAVIYQMKKGTQFGICAMTTFASEKDDTLIAAAPSILDQLIRLMEEREACLRYCQEQNGLPDCKNCGLTDSKI